MHSPILARPALVGAIQTLAGQAPARRRGIVDRPGGAIGVIG
jgi:hypothetical protein